MKDIATNRLCSSIYSVFKQKYFHSTPLYFFIFSSARVKVAAISCPSPPMTYAAEGDNVTLCWRIVANSSIVSRYYVRALSRPVESVMDPVGSANGTGYFEKVYPRKHDGNYVNRATVIADLSAGMVYLKITNYTKKMDNVYCVHYQSRLGMNDLTPCHSQALLLRNIGEYVYLKCEYAGL